MTNARFRSGFFFLFVFSGMLKWIPFFPIDPTILFGVPVISNLVRRILVLKYVIIRRVRRALFTTLLFFFWYVFSATYSISDVFWHQKLLGIILNIISFVFPVLCLKKWEDFHYFNRCLIILSTLTIVSILVLKASDNMGMLLDSRNPGEGEYIDFPDYLNIGTVIGLGVLFLFYSSGKINIIIGLSGIAAIAVIGARGPFVFTLLMLALGFLYRHKNKLLSLKFYWYFAGISVCIWGVLQWEGAALLVQRFSVFNYDWGNSKLNDVFRVHEFTIAIDVISEYFFFGTGLGGYGIAGFGIDENFYPHNILLEAFAETGFFGGILFCICLLANLHLIPICVKDKTGAIYVILSMFMLLNFMKSGGFIGGRYLFVFWGLVASYSNYLVLTRNNKK